MVLVNAVRDGAIPDCGSAHLGRTAVTLYDEQIARKQSEPLEFVAKQLDLVHVIKI